MKDKVSWSIWNGKVVGVHSEKLLIVTASACIPVLFACIVRACRSENAKLLVHVAEACYELVPRFRIDLWKIDQHIVDFQADAVLWLIGLDEPKCFETTSQSQQRQKIVVSSGSTGT